MLGKLFRTKGGAALVVFAVVLTVILVSVPSAWAQSKYKTLLRFFDGGSWDSTSGLILDKAGNLYGARRDGGGSGSCNGGCGEIFKLARQPDGSWRKSVLHSFNGNGTDGYWPMAGLIFDQAGCLYGTTNEGGPAGSGTVFKLTPKPDGNWTESVLYSFTGYKDGGNPWASLILDPAGILYGTTFLGGSLNDCNGGCGVVFRLTPNADGSWTEKVLHQFTGGKDGGFPRAGLIFDQAWNLYGTTEGGGSLSDCQGGCGVVFELTPNADGSWAEKTLHRFRGGKDGAAPWAGLIFDGAGSLYGTTSEGGKSGCYGGCGVVFQLASNSDGTWRARTLYSFCSSTNCADGAGPLASLIFDTAGNLYGSTIGGGKSRCEGHSSCGVIFKLAPESNGGWNETVAHYFLGNPGASPWAGLIFDAVGNLYGTTSGNDSKTFGSVFEITP